MAEGILASCSFESTVKFWDFQNNENYVLNIQDQNPLAVEEIVSCINYCTGKGELLNVFDVLYDILILIIAKNISVLIFV